MNLRQLSGPLLLFPLFIVLSLPSHAEKEGDFEYSIKDNAVTITKYTGQAETVTIPEKIAGLPVRLIGDSAFWGNMKVTTIAMPTGITGIGNLAFGKTALVSVIVPPSVTHIGRSPFSECKSLKNITVDPDNRFYLGKEGVLFNKDGTTLIQYPSGSPGENYTIPEGVITIGPSAFYPSPSLNDITIARTVTHIDHAAFSGMKIKSIELPASVTKIDNNAFSGCNLDSISFGGSVPSELGKHAFIGMGNPVFRYYKGVTGFTTPEWNGYKTVEIDPATEIFDWTSSDGKAIKAKFIKLEGDAVVIEKEDGKQFTLPLSKLSPVSAGQAKALARITAK